MLYFLSVDFVLEPNGSNKYQGLSYFSKLSDNWAAISRTKVSSTTDYRTTVESSWRDNLSDDVQNIVQSSLLIDASKKWEQDTTGLSKRQGTAYFSQLHSLWSTISRKSLKMDFSGPTFSFESYIGSRCSVDHAFVFSKPEWKMIEGTWGYVPEPLDAPPGRSFDELLKLIRIKARKIEKLLKKGEFWRGRDEENQKYVPGMKGISVYDYLYSFIMVSHVSQMKFDRLLSNSDTVIDESAAIEAVGASWGSREFIIPTNCSLWHDNYATRYPHKTSKSSVDESELKRRASRLFRKICSRYAAKARQNLWETCFSAFLEPHNKNIEALNSTLASSKKCSTLDPKVYSAQLRFDQLLSYSTSLGKWISKTVSEMRCLSYTENTDIYCCKGFCTSSCRRYYRPGMTCNSTYTEFRPYSCTDNIEVSDTNNHRHFAHLALSGSISSTSSASKAVLQALQSTKVKLSSEECTTVSIDLKTLLVKLSFQRVDSSVVVASTRLNSIFLEDLLLEFKVVRD